MREFVRMGALLLLVLTAFAVVGHLDMRESERMELLDHHVTIYEADTIERECP